MYDGESNDPHKYLPTIGQLFSTFFSGTYYQVTETKEGKELIITALTPTMTWYLPALKINLNKALAVYSQGQELAMFSQENNAPVSWIPYGQQVLADDTVSVHRIKRGLENHLLAVNALKESGKNLSLPNSPILLPILLIKANLQHP